MLREGEGVCFSVEADLVAGAVVTAIGVDSMRRARSRPDKLLASIPLVLGLHLLVEVPVWLSLEGEVASWVGSATTWTYLGLAFLVVPPLAPVAVLAAAAPDRRDRLRPFVVLGGLVMVALLDGMLRGPVESAIEGHHIAYDTGLRYGGTVVAAYVLATCGPAVLSGDRGIAVFGWINIGAVATLVWVEQTALISLWCAWAAATSAAVAIRIRRRAVARPSVGGELDESVSEMPARSRPLLRAGRRDSPRTTP